MRARLRFRVKWAEELLLQLKYRKRSTFLENNKRVLVVDDEVHIRRVLELKLKGHGYQVIMAQNGEEGIDIIQKEKPDVVISDINMPKMDGKTLCEKTNNLKNDRRFLTIIITARVDPEDHKWIGNMRDTLFMEKPFSPTKILSVIQRYLGGQR
jgi:two-component system chemotaxis response regulator CheY